MILFAQWLVLELVRAKYNIFLTSEFGLAHSRKDSLWAACRKNMISRLGSSNTERTCIMSCGCALQCTVVVYGVTLPYYTKGDEDRKVAFMFTSFYLI